MDEVADGIFVGTESDAGDQSLLRKHVAFTEAVETLRKAIKLENLKKLCRSNAPLFYYIVHWMPLR